MSFIPKNPITAPKVSSTPSSPREGTRGLYAGNDGWYDIDSNGNENKIITSAEVADDISEHNTDTTSHPDIRQILATIEGIYCGQNEPTGNELIWIKPPTTGDTDSHIYYRSSSNSEWKEVADIEDIPDLSGYARSADLTAHTGNINNPHNVTKSQIGLGNVDNTSDLDKPISTATQNKLRNLEHYGDADITPTEQNLFDFEVNDSVNHTATLTQYNSNQGKVVVPYAVKINDVEYVVDTIGAYAFATNHSLTSVILPNTILNIGEEAFGDCMYMSNITMSSAITFGRGAFDNCQGLVNITIPEGVTEIPEDTVQDCVDLKDIVIPNSVTSIGDSAFAGCSSLDNVYYWGSKSEWEQIEIDPHDNDAIELANLFFDYVKKGEYAISADLTAHTGNTNNPHGVTKAQVGLENVDNIKQATKTEFDTHTENTNNPHGVTKSQVGLGNVDNTSDATKEVATAEKLKTARTINGVAFDGTSDITIADNTKIPTSSKGSASGVAELDANGKVPSSQLPSYVDDVIEGTLATFPRPGESGKIYVDTNSELSYRWSGSDYVEISPSIALGETASTAYAGNKGKKNADDIANLQLASSSQGNRISTLESGKADSADLIAHTSNTNNPHNVDKTDVGLGNVDNAKQATKAEFDTHTSDTQNPHQVTKAQVGLGNVDNTSDANKPISMATQNALTDIQNKFRSLEHYGDANIVPSAQSLFYFEVDNVNHTATVTAATTSLQGNVVVPYEYVNGDNTYTVTAIGHLTYGNTRVASIIIPNTIATIGSEAFLNCRSLTSIVIPDSVTSVGNYAFYACDHLTDVYYGGSVEDWSQILIGAQNEQLYNATIHYAKTKQIYPITFGDWVNGKFIANENGEGNYIMGCTPAGVKYVRQISSVPVLKEVYGFSPNISQSVTDTSADFYTDSQLKIYKASVVGLDSRIYTTTYDNDKETPYGQGGASTGLREGRYIVHPRGTQTVIAFGSELVAYGGHVKVSFELGCHRAWQTGTIGYTLDGTDKSGQLQSNAELWRHYEFSVSSDAGTLGTLSGDSTYNGMSGIVINYTTATDGTEYFWIRNLKVEPEGFEFEI